MTENEIIREVHWRNRICNYLFLLAFLWIIAGIIVAIGNSRANGDWPSDTFVFVGLGIFTAALTLSFAISRCPVCDGYLNRFRPDKERCAHCGAKVR